MSANSRKRTDPRFDIRLSVNFVREEYRLGGIILISDYRGFRKPNRLRCAICGFEWCGTYDGFKRHGNRCFQCESCHTPKNDEVNPFDRIDRTRIIQVGAIEQGGNQKKKRKITVSDCIELAASSGGFFLSKEYRGSQYSYQWKCGFGHVWSTTHASVRKGSWCPLCSKKMGRHETECRIIFESLVGGNFPPIVCNGERGKPEIRNPKTGFPLRLDGFNIEHKLAFEYQGEHHYPHFEKHPPYVTPELVKSVRRKDKIKKEHCARLGIRLIVIPYWEADIRFFVCSFLRDV